MSSLEQWVLWERLSLDQQVQRANHAQAITVHEPKSTHLSQQVLIGNLSTILTQNGRVDCIRAAKKRRSNFDSFFENYITLLYIASQGKCLLAELVFWVDLNVCVCQDTLLYMWINYRLQSDMITIQKLLDKHAIHLDSHPTMGLWAAVLPLVCFVRWPRGVLVPSVWCTLVMNWIELAIIQFTQFILFSNMVQIWPLIRGPMSTK